MSIIRWLWHAISGCPEADLDHTMYGTTHCRTCGRVTFVSDTLPKITRLKTPARRLSYH
ncbi:hypothetical protein [Sporomusa acidovorans]|uniref:Transposase zinc-ribbon domain-containing protein n=1 Tax=Sporomusa acidovorans (strain ATCC 49682 / DSM 3132 / Mol) TaxID=1123286 RepID=A0ABZ3JA27_SPOA4|nr:hypothetical protein [Sporomusa acidovorans]OZC21653.1 hypothetical protein SPACI_17270 [Sporomusa acidovorans DSM 3132]SDD60930.1 hypothetical protein SAMN04488499_1002211 [Sporomusa acidovorans]